MSNTLVIDRFVRFYEKNIVNKEKSYVVEIHDNKNSLLVAIPELFEDDDKGLFIYLAERGLENAEEELLYTLTLDSYVDALIVDGALYSLEELETWREESDNESSES